MFPHTGYYPHLLTINGYISRNIPDPGVYAKMLEERMQAKKSGDKAKANALKLVANTTYGAQLNAYNDLYDPLMARSTCISGQLYLLELANHLYKGIDGLRVAALNTDGIMVEFDDSQYDDVNAIIREWQDRTGFTLEEDKIKTLIQGNVNNYIEIGYDDSLKIKGGYLVRGISTAGAFNINNTYTIIPKAIIAYYKDGTPIEDTINACNEPLEFQMVAKASSKYAAVWHIVNGYRVQVQRCNRVYAAKDKTLGTLYKTHKETGTDAKIADLPEHCVIDNDNHISIEEIDKAWYIRKAKKMADDFLGIEPPKVNKRTINRLMKEALKILEGE